MTDDDTRKPPHDEDLEEQVISCLMQPGRQEGGFEEVSDFVDRLTDQMFFDPRNAMILKSCRRLIADTIPINPQNIDHDLKENDSENYSKTGMRLWLDPLPEVSPSRAMFWPFFKRLCKLSKARELLKAGIMCQQTALDPKMEKDGLIDDFIALVQSIADKGEQKKWIEFLTPGECADYEDDGKDLLVGDRHLVLGSISVIAGHPGVGKSRLSATLALAGATGEDWMGLKVHRKFKTQSRTRTVGIVLKLNLETMSTLNGISG